MSEKLMIWIKTAIPKKAFVSVLPSEAGGGIRRMAVRRSIEIRAASAMGVQYPKTVANLFYMDRRLLAKLSQCAWKVMNLYLTQAVPYDDAKAGAAVACSRLASGT